MMRTGLRGRAPMLIAVAVALWLVTAVVGCGDDSSQGAPGEASTTPESAADWATIDEWLASAAEPPDDCALAEPVSLRPDISPGVRLGPAYMVFGSSGPPILNVNPRDMALKTLFVVGQEAGSRIIIQGRALDGTGEMLFEYKTGLGQETNPVSGLPAVRSDHQGARQLELYGPFDVELDAARGYLRPTRPGCYELTAHWDAGTASTFIYVYGSGNLCYPPCR